MNQASPIKRLLAQRSTQIILILTLYGLIESHLPLIVHQGLYTISLFLKDVLIWVMPLTVGIFIASTILSFKRKAPLLILVLLIFETCSNFCSVWFSFLTAHIADAAAAPMAEECFKAHFEPLWRLGLTKPDWWSASRGVLGGIAIGFLTLWQPLAWMGPRLVRARIFMEFLLTRIFARLIPLFVLGFVAYMYQTQLFTHLLENYITVTLWLLTFLTLYISFLFWASAGFSFTGGWRAFRNLLPAGGTAFASGCSLSTMPWTIQGTAKNLDDPSLAQAIIPSTTNVQQIGDVIANTFLCFLLYTHFYGSTPDPFLWLKFSLAFVVARFATAAILGGAIFIMIPIYEEYLNFSGEMIAILLAFNVIFDPIITSSNVLANGALCRIFERFWQKITRAAI